jgi:hypothetical protein
MGEAGLQRLLDLEAIKRLKYAYIRCMTLAQWDELETLLAPDVTTSYSDGRYVFTGRDELMGFLRGSHGAQSPLRGQWQVVHPEIDFDGDARATGRWLMYHYNVDKRAQTGEQQYAYYHDEYRRRDGRWVIQSTGYQRILEEHWRRADLPSLRIEVG